MKRVTRRQRRAVLNQNPAIDASRVARLVRAARRFRSVVPHPPFHGVDSALGNRPMIGPYGQTHAMNQSAGTAAVLPSGSCH